MILFDSPELLEEPPGSREDYLRTFGKDALIVIDPVDPSRNVASPISRETLDYTVRASRALISNPSRNFFSPFSSRPHSPGEDEGLADYGGVLFNLRLPPGDPGVTSTQLRRYLRKLKGELERRGFQEVLMRFLLRFSMDSGIEPGYLRARNTWSKKEGEPDTLICITTNPPILDEEYIHWGPPLQNPRVKDFNLKWGEKARIDHSRERVYTLIRRDEVRVERITLAIWEEMHRGGSFSTTPLTNIDPSRIPIRELETLKGNFVPWT
jgi:tRNA nucleotidyltransferase (CCA-adding enzyme)